MTKFQTIERGQKYRVPITLANGFERNVLVRKTQEMNPSVRGGAYRTVWLAYNGSMNLKVRGDTRQGAYDKAIAVLTEWGAL